MSDRLVRAFVSIRTSAQALPARAAAAVTDQRGFSTYLATGLLLALTGAVGVSLLTSVPSLVTSWVSHLLTACTASGATSTTCP